jgi:hypothetical protein
MSRATDKDETASETSDTQCSDITDIQSEFIQEKESTESATLFIFYSLTDNYKPHFWAYSEKVMDETGWEWVGSGNVNPLGELYAPNSPYTREEQFSGPIETREIMRSYLGSVLYNLQSLGVVFRYKISKYFDPFYTIDTGYDSFASTNSEKSTGYYIINPDNEEVFSSYSDIVSARETAITMAKEFMFREPEYSCCIHEENDVIQVVGSHRYYPTQRDSVLFTRKMVKK